MYRAKFNRSKNKYDINMSVRACACVCTWKLLRADVYCELKRWQVCEDLRYRSVTLRGCSSLSVDVLSRRETEKHRTRSRSWKNVFVLFVSAWSLRTRKSALWVCESSVDVHVTEYSPPCLKYTSLFITSNHLHINNEPVLHKQHDFPSD